MIIGTFFATIFRIFLSILKMILYQPWLLLKFAFIWFFVIMAVTYGYFLWTHQDYMIKIRQQLAVKIAMSLWFGFLSATMITALYEFILQMLCRSKLFLMSADTICSLSLVQSDPSKLFKITGFLMIIISSVWVCFSLEPLIAAWYEKRIVDGYAWSIIGALLLAGLFLWYIS